MEPSIKTMTTESNQMHICQPFFLDEANDRFVTYILHANNKQCGNDENKDQGGMMKIKTKQDWDLRMKSELNQKI